jgi:hypothetical protein
VSDRCGALGGWGRRFIAALSLLSAPLAFGATALFPRPLHLVRQVDDPISKTTATIDEYCAGNRVVTVRGSKVTIADYDAQQLTEIDHAAQTWSVTPFADIAASRAALDAKIGAAPAPRAARLTASSSIHSSGAVETFVADAPQRHLEVGIDRRVSLSRAAAEVLIGAAYPGKGSEEQEAILDAAGNKGVVSAMSVGAKSETTYGLVAERTLTIESGGTTLISHNKILRVGDEMPPADVTLIDPGAKRIESRTTRLSRELREIDTLPSANVQH